MIFPLLIGAAFAATTPAVPDAASILSGRYVSNEDVLLLQLDPAPATGEPVRRFTLDPKLRPVKGGAPVEWKDVRAGQRLVVVSVLGDDPPEALHVFLSETAASARFTEKKGEVLRISTTADRVTIGSQGQPGREIRVSAAFRARVGRGVFVRLKEVNVGEIMRVTTFEFEGAEWACEATLVAIPPKVPDDVVPIDPP